MAKSRALSYEYQVWCFIHLFSSIHSRKAGWVGVCEDVGLVRQERYIPLYFQFLHLIY